MFLILTLVILLISILFFYPAIRRFLKMKETFNKIPGPKPYPIIGNLLETATLKKEERISYLMEVEKKYGEISCLWAGGFNPTVLLNSAECAEMILSSNIHTKKKLIYEFLEPWLGTGLLTASGKKWSVWRKILTPAFHFTILETFLNVFNQNSATLVQKLESHVDAGEFNLYPYLYNCTLDIICESTMGIRIDAQNGKAQKYIECVHGISECIMKRMLNFFYHIDIIYSFTSFYRTQTKLLKDLHGMSTHVIHERIKERKMSKEKNLSERETHEERKKRKAFLDILLDVSDASESAFSIADIREQVDTFMFEGHDTTAAGLAWTIYFIGCNPQIQEKIFEELDSVFGSSDRPVNMDDLANLKYLECVFKESIRLFPPIPVIARVVEEDITVGGYEILAGTVAFIGIMNVHRSAKHYTNPDKFDPSHFYPDEVKKRHPFAYIPFSAGARNCIGQRYALMKQKTVLATLFRKYRVESTQNEEEIQPTIDLVLRPGHGPFIKIQRRY